MSSHCTLESLEVLYKFFVILSPEVAGCLPFFFWVGQGGVLEKQEAAAEEAEQT